MRWFSVYVSPIKGLQEVQGKCILSYIAKRKKNVFVHFFNQSGIETKIFSSRQFKPQMITRARVGPMEPGVMNSIGISRVHGKNSSA